MKNTLFSSSNFNLFCFNKALKISIVSTCLSFTTLTHAGKYKEIERPTNNSELKDTWVVEYEADDFTDKIEHAKLLYIPNNMQDGAAFFFRCQPYYTNFSIQYSEAKQNLLEDGTLPNASSKFAKHGYIYDTKQDLTVEIEGDDETYDISVGGQNNHITKLFKTTEKLQADQLGMSLFFTFNFTEMPSFRKANSTDEAVDFFSQLNNAIKEKQTIQFSLKNSSGWQREFSLDTHRMLASTPSDVLDFCMTNRTIQ